MKIAVSADWHADYMSKTYLVDGFPNREIDLDKQINIMVRECVERKVEYFVIAGDLFDKSIIDGYYFDKVVDMLDLFQVQGIKVIIIPGNHEVRESGSPLTNVLNRLNNELVRTYNKICLVPDTKIVLIPHVQRNVYKEFENYTGYVKSEISKFKVSKPVVIGHFQSTKAVPGAEQEMFAGSTRFVDCSIFKNALVICGHVHKPQELTGRVVVPGSPVRLSLSERQETKRFVIYDTVTQNLESVNLDCQKMALINIDMVSKNTLDMPIEKLKKYKNCLIYVRINTNKKNRYAISARDIASKFEEVGAKVMDYEVRTVKEEKLKKVDDKEKTKIISMAPNKIFVRKANETIESVEDRKRIIKLGNAIMEDCNHA